ncbi:MAG: hypothetical protein Kow00122_03190 [Thermoleophilia bacterium]
MRIGFARREIGRSVSVSRNTVADVIRRAEVAGLSWPLPEELDEAILDARLYPPTGFGGRWTWSCGRPRSRPSVRPGANLWVLPASKRGAAVLFQQPAQAAGGTPSGQPRRR